MQIYLSARATPGLAPPLTVTALCASYGISRQTFYRWLRRFEREGYAGLFDRPAGRPQLPHRTCLFAELRPQIIFWRRWLGLSCRQITAVLRQWVQVSHVTIRRLLRLWGVPGRVYKRTKKRWQRFERAQPDDLWQLDHSWSDFDGQWRLSILDDHSRFVVCCQVVPDLSAATVCRLLTQTIAQLGGRRPRQLLSDHGSAFQSAAYRQLLARLGIQPVYARVRHPQTVGKLERFHRTFQENAWLFEHPEQYLQYYNEERGHTALGGLPPTARYWGRSAETIKNPVVLTSLAKAVTRFG